VAADRSYNEEMKRFFRKRTLVMILLLLASGAIINVTVAWGLALQIEIGFGPATPPLVVLKEQDWIVDHLKFDPNAAPISKVWRLTGFGREHSSGSTRTESEQAAWAGCDMNRDGWPFRSMKSEAWFGNPASKLNGFHGVWRPTWIDPKVFRRTGCFGFAMQPIWPGFAINTMFYAAILWPIFAAPGRVRRFIRGRRGQCPACAYPVGSSTVCTECGRPVGLQKSTSPQVQSPNTEELTPRV
jgi:hypothetical protein